MANLNGHRWPSLGRQADARAAYVQTVCYLPDKRRTANRTVCCVPLRSTLQSDPFVMCMNVAVHFLCDTRQSSFLPCAR